jgi:purine-binding chemotaxis protein CheW
MTSMQHVMTVESGRPASVAANSGASPTQPSGATSVRAAIISMGGELFTIDLRNVREVFVVESITPVPGMPSGLVGVTNLRGTVIPLLDLRPMFALNAEAVLQYAVVIKHGNWQVGVLVDAVPEIRTLSKDQFLPAPTGTREGTFPFVSTVVKLEDRLRGVLETSAVLSHFEGAG